MATRILRVNERGTYWNINDDFAEDADERGNRMIG